MNSSFIFNPKVRRVATWALIIGILITLSAQILAHAAMTNWFQVKVSNITFYNKNGLNGARQAIPTTKRHGREPCAWSRVPAWLPEQP